MELHQPTHSSPTAARSSSCSSPPVVRHPLDCYVHPPTTQAQTLCCLNRMPESSTVFLNTTFNLEPELRLDVAPSAANSLRANILRQLFIEAARIALNNPYEHDDIVARRLLRGAARIEAWRSGSPLVAHRHPPPLLTPPPSPGASPLLEDDDGPAMFLACLSCEGCPRGCNPPYSCWHQLSPRRQRALREEHAASEVADL